MKILALDTSSHACSVALRIDEHVIERYAEQPREHTRLLLPMIRDVIDESDLELKNLDLIALGNGPGSFIGMRIAASVAQGLAHGAGLNIVPVSSLAAVAAQVFDEFDADEVTVSQDAHMNEVYLGGFRRGSDDLPEALFAERLHAQQAILEFATASAGTRLAAGAGWSRYPALLQSNRDRVDKVIPVLYPRAKYLLGIAARSRALAREPTQLIPAYLRHTVAAVPSARS